MAGLVAGLARSRMTPEAELAIVRRSRIWQGAERVSAPFGNRENGTIQAALRWRLGKLLQGRALSELRGPRLGTGRSRFCRWPDTRRELASLHQRNGRGPRAGGSRQENVPVGRDTDVASRNRG